MLLSSCAGGKLDPTKGVRGLSSNLVWMRDDGPGAMIGSEGEIKFRRGVIRDFLPGSCVQKDGKDEAERLKVVVGATNQ